MANDEVWFPLDGELMDNVCWEQVVVLRNDEVDSKRVDNREDEATVLVGGDVLGSLAAVELPPIT